MFGSVDNGSGEVFVNTVCCLLRQKFVVAPTARDIVSDIRSTTANVGAEYQLQPTELQDFVPTEHGELGGEVLPAADVNTLSQAIEKER